MKKMTEALLGLLRMAVVVGLLIGMVGPVRITAEGLRRATRDTALLAGPAE